MEKNKLNNVYLNIINHKNIKRYFYDCEFEETSSGIKLISIGIVDENKRSLYLINKDYDWNNNQNEWLNQNVKPYILNANDKFKFSYNEFKQLIIDFIQSNENDDIRLYGYYSAYDHVVLCQIFGRMIDLPKGMPMFTYDLKQYLELFKINKDNFIELNQENEHSAIDDAIWNLKLFNFLTKYSQYEL